MKPLNATEWLEAERMAGNPFADELLELFEAQEEARDNADVYTDLNKLVPEDIQNHQDKWRMVEWITDNLHMLKEIEESIEAHGTHVTWPNGTMPSDAADKLEAMFASDHWKEFDL